MLYVLGCPRESGGAVSLGNADSMGTHHSRAGLGYRDGPSVSSVTKTTHSELLID